MADSLDPYIPVETNASPDSADVATAPATEEPALDEEVWSPRAPGDTAPALARLLGLPRATTEPNYSLLDRRIEGGLVIEEFSFDAEPGEEVSGILAKPDGATERLPAVLCLHGVNQGRKTVMGPEYTYDTRLNWLRGWGRELASQGFVTMGITQRTFGKRPGELSEQGKLELLYGRTLMGAFAWEAMASLDQLAARDDVDPQRIGLMGYGLGGIVGFYTAALDDRVKALVTVCGGVGSLDIFARWANPDYHDVSYYLPGILDQFDHPEIAASLAPRAYLLLTRDGDDGMPLEGVRRIEWESGAAWMERAVPNRLAVSVRPGAHNFTADDMDEAINWFNQWLVEVSPEAFTEADPTAPLSPDAED